jgi:serine/threonine-protein kinase
LWRDWDLPGAERELTKAIALDSGYATAHLFLAWVYVGGGQPARALREAQMARQVDPLSVIVNTRVGSMFYYAHDYAAAEAQLRRTLDLDSTNAIAHAELARVYVARHRCGDALAQLRFIPPTLPNYEGSITGYAYAACGQRAQALAVLRDLEDRSRREFVMAAKLAIIYAALGERDSALARLQQAAAQREWPILVLGVDPLFDSLRGDPRFTRVAQRSP